MVSVETFTRLEDVPDDAADLFAGARGFFSTRAWWDAVLTHAMPDGASPRLVLIRSDGRARALFPMMGHQSLTTPYTCLYEPLFANDVTDRAPLYADFARFLRSSAVTRMDALDELEADAMAAGAWAAGLYTARFDHFGNWHEQLQGRDWNGYMADRPGALRETVRRRLRRADRLTNARFRLFTGLDDLETGIAAFEAVYARSWKDPEPFLAFNPAQIRAAAGLGIGRLGVWWIDDVPAAAQFWVIEHSLATVLKLAHDEAFKANSPGTVVTAWMIRHMIEQEAATGLDFGRGDDPYKRDWVASRRQRVGLLLVNPRLPRGILELTRHALGRVRARLR